MKQKEVPMNLILLKSKIHNACVTDASLRYEGSLTIDRDLMDIAGIVPYEKVLVSNMSNGSRFETYIIEGPRQSRSICLNGAAAHLGTVGDLLTIFTFCTLSPEEAKVFKPRIVVLGENNTVVKISGGSNDK